MALSTESAGRVRQKCYGFSRNNLVTQSLKALFLHLATQKGNPDLQYAPFLGTTIDDAGGQVLIDAPCTLWAVYARKGTLDMRTAGTGTDAYLVIFDDATDDAGAGTDGRLVLPLLVASEEAWWASPDGVVMGTGVVAKSYTDFDGTTDSSAGDAPNGFVIVSA